MAIIVRDEFLEQQIDKERELRGDSTNSKTLVSLARERLTQLDYERKFVPNQSQSEHEPQPA